MNQKAKRRHQLGQFGPGWDEPEPVKAEIAKPSVEPVGEGQHSFGVSEEQARWRLDKFLAHAAGLSRSRIKALIESAQVSIDQAPAPDSNQKLRLGQMVEIHEPVRLLVIVDAPAERILAAAAKVPVVQRMAANRWIQLAAWDPAGGLAVFADGRFVPYEGDRHIQPVVERSIDWYAGHREHLPPARVLAALADVPEGGRP